MSTVILAISGAAKGKAKATKGHKLAEKFAPGEILNQTQPAKKKWRLGDVIGQGGFGMIYTGKIRCSLL